MSTFNRNTLTAALAVSLASLVSAPAHATGAVNPAAQAPFAFEVTGVVTTGTDPLADAQGFGFSVAAPDILIGRTNTSGDITVFVTFSGADVASTPVVSSSAGAIGATTFGGNTLQFTISPPATPGIVASQLFNIANLNFKNALSLQPAGGGITATVRIVDTNTNIELLGNTTGAVLSGAWASKTTFAPKTNLTVDVTSPSQKKNFVAGGGIGGTGTATWAQIGSLTVDLDNFTFGTPPTTTKASVAGTAAVPNDSNGVAAGGTFQFDTTKDTVNLTLTVPATQNAFTFFVQPSAVPCSGTPGGVTLTQSLTDPTKFSGVLAIANAAAPTSWNICTVVNGTKVIDRQTISGTARINLADTHTIDPAAVTADIVDVGFNGSVVKVFTFNPAGNTTQQSFLRVSNTGNTSGLVTVEGIDDNGVQSPGKVTFNLVAGKSLQFNSSDLEAGNTGIGLTGSLGDGVGKWRLVVTAEFDGMLVTSLNRNNTTGTLTNITDADSSKEQSNENK